METEASKSLKERPANRQTVRLNCITPALTHYQNNQNILGGYLGSGASFRLDTYLSHENQWLFPGSLTVCVAKKRAKFVQELFLNLWVFT